MSTTNKGSFLFPFLALGGALFVMIILLMLVAVVGSERQQQAAEEAVDLSQAVAVIRYSKYACTVDCTCTCPKADGSTYTWTLSGQSFETCVKSYQQNQAALTSLCISSCKRGKAAQCSADDSKVGGDIAGKHLKNGVLKSGVCIYKGVCDPPPLY